MRQMPAPLTKLKIVETVMVYVLCVRVNYYNFSFEWLVEYLKVHNIMCTISRNMNVEIYGQYK